FLIGALGRWALAAGCREASAWPASARLAVNLSPHQLVRGDLLATIQAILAETGLPAHRLDLEITENAAVAEIERTARLLSAIRDLGVRIALDDFGAGHASFSYLQRLPLDVLKIDREFVRAIDEGRQGRAIVTAIIELSRGLGLQTVAEGVETPAQLDFLRERGCDLYQGYLASAAIPSAAARRWILGNG
ncbi:MAG: EAL domain-containing protein, partial [Acidobacteriota bacterium]